MSVANLVRLYLKNRPYVLEALEKDIANLSKLSRIIQKDLNVENVHAIKAALRRYAEQLKKAKERRGEKVLVLLKESKITILDNVSIAITNRDLPLENKVKVKLNSHYVYLIDKELSKQVQNKFRDNLIRMNENCTAIIISSPEKLEKVPGVVAFLTSLLAEQNINVIEFISCYTETIIVVDRGDALKSYEALSRLIG